MHISVWALVPLVEMPQQMVLGLERDSGRTEENKMLEDLACQLPAFLSRRIPSDGRQHFVPLVQGSATC
eukprot:4887619-Pyramimonas_sp.AAC.1